VSSYQVAGRPGPTLTRGPRATGLTCVTILLMCSACRGERPPEGAQRIPEIPDRQQRVVARRELDWRWPFTGGVGTLGCANGAVVFRFEGVTYGVNDAAKSLGFAPVEPIRLTQSSGWPRDPLKRVPQDQRRHIFRSLAACGHDGAGEPLVTTPCRQRLRESWGLSESELAQIDAEGLERLWPPLSPKQVSLDPLIEIGLELCAL